MRVTPYWNDFVIRLDGEVVVEVMSGSCRRIDDAVAERKLKLAPGQLGRRYDAMY